MSQSALHPAQPQLLTAHPGDDLRQVQAAARAARRAQPQRRVIVELAGGTYFLSETLTFTAEDNHTTWRSRVGERAVLSGGRPVSGWRVEAHDGHELWVVELEPGLEFTQLWLDGRRRSWPRLPATGFYHFTNINGHPESSPAYAGPRAAGFVPGQLDPAWRNLSDIRLTTYQLWHETHLRLASIDGERSLMHFTAPAIRSLRDERNEYARFIIENVAEAHVVPGTWYFDRASGRLAYLPLPGEFPSTSQVVRSHLAEVVVFAGSAEAPVVGVQLEHLGLHHADFVQDPQDPGTAQASVNVPGAVRLRWAEDCVLYGCELAHVAQYGIQIEAGSVRPVIAATTIHDLGAGGIRIDHEEMITDREWPHRRPQALTRPEPIAATVADCTIRDAGHRYPSAIGIWIGNSGFHRIRHNHLHDLPYTGISSGWHWNYLPTRTVAVLIEGNHVHHINHRGLLSDNGGIYTLGRHPGGRVCGNFVHDVDCYGYGGWGLYPDEGSSEFLIAGNVVLRTAQPAFSMHYGRACLVTGNLLSSFNGQVNLGRQEHHRSVDFAANTVVSSGGTWAKALTFPSTRFRWRDNLLHDPQRSPLSAADLAEQQAQGQHLGTRIADPLVGDLDGLTPAPRADGLGAAGFPQWQGALSAGPRLRILPATYAEYAAEVRDEPPGQTPVIETVLERVGFAQRLANGQQQVTVQVTWRNPGLVPARAAAQLRSTPGTVCEPALTIDRELAPGAAVTSTVTVTAPLGLEEVWVESSPVSGPAMAHMVVFDLQSEARPVTLPCLATAPGTASDQTAIAQVAQLLAGQPPQEVRVRRKGPAIATARFAVIGQHLAVALTVRDARPHHDAFEPWKGSCVEIFAAPTGDKKTTGQVFLLPATPSAAPYARSSGFNTFMDPAHAGITSRLIADGYTLEALVPFAGLGLPADAGSFHLELAVTAIRNLGAAPERAAWVHALAPHVESEGMAAVGLA